MSDMAGNLSARDNPLLRMLRHQYTWLVVILGGLFLFNVLFTDNFAPGRAAELILDQVAPVALLAIGMTLVIATAGIDLSVGSVMALAGAVSAIVIVDHGGSAATAVALGLLAGLLVGAWNGVFVTFVGLQPIVATLITLVAGRGLAQLLTDSQKPSFNAPGYEFLGSGDLLGIPVPIFIAITAFVVVATLLRKTVLGMYIEAVGANPRAARLCGLRVHAIRMAVYIISGICAGWAGIIATADIAQADVAKCGLYLELDAILAVVLGGTSLMGGRPLLLGSMLGAIVMQTLTITLQMHGVQDDQSLIFKAIIAVVVCAMQSPRIAQRVGHWIRPKAVPA